MNHYPESTLRDYLTGLVLAAALTIAPFWLVITHPLKSGATFALLAVCALVQLLVHLRFFLHLRISHMDRIWLGALLFAGVLILIMVGGSLWIMWDLNMRMV
ncbi:cytochrome o ubiquinol oxidase subunit IV [Parendozoicomonas haliclonae]|nr:cytochrome o ubiquinol oxidase subunit IV [Parendozoicomonas haliclonae]